MGLFVIITMYNNSKIEERYTGLLSLKCMVFPFIDRYNTHPNTHWVAGLNKYCISHESHLC